LTNIQRNNYGVAAQANSEPWKRAVEDELHR
jgi:hypothetical protein